MCPKQSPERAERLRLTAANVATLNLYWRNKATMGCLNDAERQDQWLQRNFAIIDATIRGWELQQSIGFASMVLGGGRRE